MAAPGWDADRAAYRSTAHYGNRATTGAQGRTGAVISRIGGDCPPSTTQCVIPGGHWYCATLATDPFNCGSCCNQCGEGQVCCRGTCVPRHQCDIPMPPIPEAITGGCPPAQQRCTNPSGCSYCTSTDWDRRNCGGCGVFCAAGQVCCRGQCMSPTTDENCGNDCSRCRDGQRCCLAPTPSTAYRCVDLGTTDHCMDCNDPCLLSEECCPTGCANLDFNSDNCGQCGNPCTGGAHCFFGQCRCRENNERYCDGVCTNIYTDPRNCGACGVACPPGYRCGGKPTRCYCGEPGATCDAGEECCNDECRDVSTDDNHCGYCGNRCGAEQSCEDGACVCPDGREVCGSRCCPAGQPCCAGTCVDTQIDSQHCGGCSRPCPAPKTCQSGQCRCPVNRETCGATCCPPGQRCCNNVCVDTQTNQQHCGGCNQPCPAPKVCQAGSCVCPPNRAACGATCCPPGQQCSNGSCCPPGLTGCDGQCVDLQSDLNHCGVCGRRVTNFTFVTTSGSQITVNLTCVNGTPQCPAGWVPCAPGTGMICCPLSNPVCTGVQGRLAGGLFGRACCPTNMPNASLDSNGFLFCHA